MLESKHSFIVFTTLAFLHHLTRTSCYRYRRKTDQLVEHASAARIPTMWGPFTAHCFKSIIDGIEHIAMVKVSNFRDILAYIFGSGLTTRSRTCISVCCVSLITKLDLLSI